MIDRIGSPNTQIQLVNFWPNIELEEYINLEQRVSGRMVLLDISASGEENLIEQQSGNQIVPAAAIGELVRVAALDNGAEEVRAMKPKGAPAVAAGVTKH